MLNLGYKIALAVGVKIETWIERALTVAVDTDRAALTVSTATDRAALSVGVKLRSVAVDTVRAAISVSTATDIASSIRVSILLPRRERALSVAVDIDRAALAMGVKI